MRSEHFDGMIFFAGRGGGTDRGPGRGGHHGQGHGSHHPEHPHGRRGGRARRGESKYLLMDALKDGAKHGYEIIKTLEERSGGQYAPSPGVVYPTLQFLAEAGFVNGSKDGERRVFELTEEGQKELSARAEEIATFWAQFTQPGAGARAEFGFLEEELEYLTRTVRGGVRGSADPELVRQIRQTVENCRNEVRRLIAASEEKTSE